MVTLPIYISGKIYRDIYMIMKTKELFLWSLTSTLLNSFAYLD